ncbi:ATP-binding protein [Vibrio fluvialis]|nr:ATP-binding protein [Vibrio fluvialis]MBY7938573.1 ATP-binding protein [Vibrio fluvialis]
MIIDFSVENFRSFKTEQVLSMYAESKHAHHAGNLFCTNDDIHTVRTTAIYGSNASGKSNILKALQALKTLVVDSGDWKDGDSISCYEPYLLSKLTKQAPTKFSIEFYLNEIRYLYEIEFNEYEITFEKLSAYYSAKPSNIFTRESPSDWKGVNFGERYKGGRRVIPFFANNTYLSKAGNSPDAPDVVKDIFNYFRRSFHILTDNRRAKRVGGFEDPKLANIMNTFLRKADFGISHFAIEPKDPVLSHSFNNIKVNINIPDDLPEELRDKLLSSLSKTECFYHEADDGELVKFEKKLESMGTIKMFDTFPMFIDCLLAGNVLAIDEIETSLHPHMAELLVKLFNDPLVNVKGAQLIFTTHEMSLMSSDLMRKDQVYLVEKSLMNGTEICSLDDFESNLKDNSPFAKWYSDGRLGGIPSINYHEISEAIKEAFNA